MFSFWEAATSPGTRQSPPWHPWWLLTPSQDTGQGCALPELCEQVASSLDSVAHLQKRDNDNLLCKVLWDLLEISTFKRGGFPFLSKAQSRSNPTVPAFALQCCCFWEEAGNYGDIAVGNIIESHNLFIFILFHSINLHGCDVFHRLVFQIML